MAKFTSILFIEIMHYRAPRHALAVSKHLICTHYCYCG